MLFAGIDKTGSHLYHMDPSGTFLEFGAKAIGSGSEGAQQSLQESYHKVTALFFFFAAEILIISEIYIISYSTLNVLFILYNWNGFCRVL